MCLYCGAYINCVILILIVSTSVSGYNFSSYDSKTVRRRNVVTYLTDSVQYIFNGSVCIVNNQWTNCPVVPGHTMMDYINRLSPADRENVLWQLYREAHRRGAPRPPYPKGFNNRLLGSLYPQNRRSLNSYIGNHPNLGLLRTPAQASPPRYIKPLPPRPGQSNNRKSNLNKKNNYASGKRAKSDKFLNNTTPTTIITETQKAVEVSTVSPSTSFRRFADSVSGEAREMTTSAGDATAATASTTLPSVSSPETSPDAPLDPAIMDNFLTSFDKFQRKLYEITFNKLASISPDERHENGISFVQSSVFLYLLLVALSAEAGARAQADIYRGLGFDIPDADKARLISEVISLLPTSNQDLKFGWSSRLVLKEQPLSQQFQEQLAPLLRLRVSRLNGTETPEELVKTLNRMVEVDSSGSMHDTFEEEELSSVVRAVLLSTVCVRAGWRAAPTLLNGTRPFRDVAAPGRTARMIRINDVMRYADLNEWDAEALEISYSTPGLTLLLVVPRGLSLRPLAARVAATGVPHLLSKMHSLRVAVTVPLYTLRMTLLLPNKFQAMNISRLVEVSENGSESEGLRLSHAVQRLMFWAEAGRNAFKDDGIEWDAPPELELLVDRPYIFFVRYHNITLLSGNFVL